jgi:hypothetical protein
MAQGSAGDPLVEVRPAVSDAMIELTFLLHPSSVRHAREDPWVADESVWMQTLLFMPVVLKVDGVDLLEVTPRQGRPCRPQQFPGRCR